jgi:Transposase and inactivated derivatives, TnpA family
MRLDFQANLAQTTLEFPNGIIKDVLYPIVSEQTLKDLVKEYSQLKSCSSSEVAAMIEGLLRHCTEMEVEKNYVDSHGQSEVAFAFCHLLGYQLMPRLKAIHSQKLYRPESEMAEAYPNLQPVLTRPINLDLIRQQYDQMVKYATALRLGIA